VSELDVAVLGGGNWGTSLAHLAALNGCRAQLWMRDADVAAAVNERHENPHYLPGYTLHPGVHATTDLEEAVRGKPLVLFVLPSKITRAVASEAGAFLTGNQVVLSATKGLERETLKRISQVLREETCVRKVGALSGPNLAKEILAGQPSATVVASHFKEVIEVSARMLHGRLFRIYGNTDLRGVELAGALKNVMAIACGVAHGLGFGHNVSSMLITRGMAEIQRLGVGLGADAHTFSGLAGIGDMIATCSSELSRNFRVGLGLARGQDLDTILEELGETAEGVNTTGVALQLGREARMALPITEGVQQLLFTDATPADVMEDLMTRAARYEIDFDYSAEV
jgi:glycerol-3-phosphate dehydrogenase (NAD(P)+)